MMNNKKTPLRTLRCLLILSMLCQFSDFGYAQFISGPISQSMGGAGRGAADEGEQILLNPAALVHASTFTSSLLYLDGYVEKNEHDRIAGFILSDNSEDVFAAGSYAFFDRRSTFPTFNSVNQQYHHISLAKFVVKQVSLGLSAFYLKSDVEGDRVYDQFDGNLALHYNPLPDLGIGLVYYNIAKRDHEVPSELQNKDKIAAGVHYIAMPIFRLRLDVGQQLVANPDSEVDLHFGMESQISQFFFTRFGWHDEGVKDRQFYSLGLGFDGPRIKIDYSYRKNADYNGGAMHGVDMRLPFW